MKTIAMIVNEYGERANFSKAEVELPSLGDSQVLIEVSATSINAVDNKILRGLPIGPELPASLHGDVSGVVVEVGAKAKNFKVGDQVFGIAGGLIGYNGASANHMIVNESLISHKPKKMNFNEAAALPLVFITAYEGLIEKAKIQKGQKLLVIGGTGGVGHQVIQLAKILGAHVTATVSGDDKADIARSLGADQVINRREVEVSDYLKVAGVEEGFDVIFDTVGGEHLDQVWELAKANGQVVSTTSMEEHDLTPVHMKGLSLHVVFMLLPMLTGQDQKRHQEILKYLATKVDEGAIKALIHEEVFALEDINKAHSTFESGKYLGKVIIENSKRLS